MKKRKFFIGLLIFIILLSYLNVIIISKKITPKILNYSKVEAKRFANLIINTSVDEVINKQNLEKNLLELTKNTANEIEIIDFNTKNVNKLLEQVSNTIQKKLIDVEEGRSENLDISNSLQGTNFSKRKKGIVCEIPAGSIYGKTLLANTGPTIPVKLTFIGKVLTSIKTSVKPYGINNAYLEVNLEVSVTERVSMPVLTDDVVVKNKIPIVMKVIQGKIPNYYNGNLEKSSSDYTLPLEE